MLRDYALKTVYNFRDFGNYETRDGGRVLPGKLFRSAHLNKASETDLGIIADLGINLVVDLRYKPERKRQPNRWPTHQSPALLEFTASPDKPVLAIAPHEAFMQNDLSVADDARAYMTRSYTARPNDPGFRDIFSKTLKHMAATEDAILIHCAAGKDRTGTLAAIILSALGVDKDTIMEDFMLTMKAVDVDSMLEPAAQMMEVRFGRPYDPESLRPMFGVEPDYLKAALGTIGDMDAYISDGLGLTKNEREALVHKYTDAA